MSEEKLLHLFNHFLDELNNGNGYTGLIKQFSFFLSSDTLLTDDIYQPIIFVTSEGKGFTSDLVEVNGDHTFHINNHLTDELWEAHCVPLNNQGILIGYLFLKKENLEKSDHKIHVETATSQLAKFIHMEQKKHHGLKQIGQRYKDSFMFDLLYGNIKSVTDILSKGELWQTDFSLPHTVIAFELKEYDYFSMDNDLLDRIHRIFEQKLTSLGIVPFILKKREELIVILPLNEQDDYKKGRQSILRVIEALRKDSSSYLGERSLTVGIGRIYDRPTELFRSYQEAKVAKILVANHQHDEVVFFSDIGLMKLLYNHDFQELKEFEYDILGELEKIDQQSEMSLLDTIEGYIKNNCDLKKASEAMFLHRNTLRYRLNKIEELLQVDLSDLQTIINFAVAFKIRHLDQLKHL
ncbi:helix-turn-helix domain-containing protein [Bacillus sp. B15-48]|uniref:PucR family transcriptional regulator n=1 Tax=Bacillus sp. B15-48 TaxID=1548601 RepID=UPI00193F2DAC|nr:helix-turn-helix domain-containing protein [Bacillus sp. B15-48]MBM4763516.1 hypothetical protein [Bacillus sp. B15-48]